ncbi:hypothetical protein SBA3_2680008 [Candidatus Sulfopaludibacter sp. SbA3]|nr:hypothetical protein SBA3_2680008 [Candidatus Sulfopaludibacter sp. SbA3]
MLMLRGRGVGDRRSASIDVGMNYRDRICLSFFHSSPRHGGMMSTPCALSTECGCWGSMERRSRRFYRLVSPADHTARDIKEVRLYYSKMVYGGPIIDFDMRHMSRYGSGR